MVHPRVRRIGEGKRKKPVNSKRTHLQILAYTAPPAPLVNPRHVGSAVHAASHASSDVAVSAFVKFPLGSGTCPRCSAYVALPVSDRRCVLSDLLLPLASDAI